MQREMKVTVESRRDAKVFTNTDEKVFTQCSAEGPGRISERSSTNFGEAQGEFRDWMLAPMSNRVDYQVKMVR